MRTVEGWWRSLGSLFGVRRARSLEAQARLSRAYQQVFTGSPTKEDQELVLADLRAVSGFGRVTDARGSTDQQLWQNEGKRWLYGHIESHLLLREADLRELEYAARREAALYQETEGTIIK